MASTSDPIYRLSITRHTAFVNFLSVYQNTKKKKVNFNRFCISISNLQLIFTSRSPPVNKIILLVLPNLPKEILSHKRTRKLKITASKKLETIKII